MKLSKSRYHFNCFQGLKILMVGVNHSNKTNELTIGHAQNLVNL